MRINAVIQAPAGSTRFPGKVLEDLGGRPVLEWVVRAAESATQIDTVIVATSTVSGDDVAAELAESLGVRVVRGSEADVLSRFVAVLDAYPADAVVRLTADCPLLDPPSSMPLPAPEQRPPATTTSQRCSYAACPGGLDVELVTADAFRAVDRIAVGHHRTHVTSLLDTKPTPYRLLGLCVTPFANDLRVTLDTREDLVLLRALVAELPDRPPAWRGGGRDPSRPPGIWWPSTHGSSRGPLAAS